MSLEHYARRARARARAQLPGPLAPTATRATARRAHETAGPTRGTGLDQTVLVQTDDRPTLFRTACTHATMHATRRATPSGSAATAHATAADLDVPAPTRGWHCAHGLLHGLDPRRIE